MTEEEKTKALTCTMCKKVKDHYCHIVYSQGDRVCTECKKETQASDNAAFDRFQNSRGIY